MTSSAENTYVIYARGRSSTISFPNEVNRDNYVYSASADGTITKIAKVEDEDGNSKYAVSIQTDAGETVVDTIPLGPELIVSEGQAVMSGDALTNNPNVGGFGQDDAEVVLQSATRIRWLLVFLFGIMLSQVMLVLKKKQVEKVQAAEMNF